MFWPQLPLSPLFLPFISNQPLTFPYLCLPITFLALPILVTSCPILYLNRHPYPFLCLYDVLILLILVTSYLILYLSPHFLTLHMLTYIVFWPYLFLLSLALPFTSTVTQTLRIHIYVVSNLTYPCYRLPYPLPLTINLIIPYLCVPYPKLTSLYLYTLTF